MTGVAVVRLVKETVITEAQARELIAFLGPHKLVVAFARSTDTEEALETYNLVEM